MKCKYAAVSNSNIMAHVSISFTLFKSAYCVQFPSVPIVFLWYFTWNALGDVDLCSSLMLVKRAIAVEEETKWAARLYHQGNQSVYVTDGFTGTSRSASILQKINMAMNCLCQILLNKKLSHKFEKWC